MHDKLPCIIVMDCLLGYVMENDEKKADISPHDCKGEIFP